MQYEWMDAYCMAKKGVETDYKEEWAATRYMLAGKMFAMRGGDKDGKPILTMKLDPAFSDYLRREYEEVVPGYYMNKLHWSSLYLEGTVPDEVVRDMIDRSYEALLGGLSKKMQKEITEV